MSYINLPENWKKHGVTAGRATIGKAVITPELMNFVSSPSLNGFSYSWLQNTSDITAGPRGVNNGTDPQGISFENKDEKLGLISTSSVVDVYDEGGNSELDNANLVKETIVEINEAIVKEATRQLYFGDDTKPAVNGGTEFNGIFTNVPVGDPRTIDAGGAVPTENTSILLTRHDKDGVIVKFGKKGLDIRALKAQATVGANGKQMEAVPVFGDTKLGVSIGKPSGVATVRNIGKNDTVIDIAFIDAIDNLISEAQLVDLSAAPNVMYLNAVLKNKMDKAVASQNNNGGLTKVADYLGIKVELTSHLPFNEDVIV